MDLRRPVVAILVGGSPAPGINSVISAAAIEAINSNCMVIGILEGQKRLKYGSASQTTNIKISDMVGIHSKGGSFLRASKEQLKTHLEVDNALRSLQHLRVRYLITIGGTETATSARILSDASKKFAESNKDHYNLYKLSVVHVPKTIFSDLPLPQDVRTFGFSTARGFGSQVIGNLLEDARTMGRYYIVDLIGAKAGHLSLGIGKSSAATLTLIPEEFDYPVEFEHIVDHVDACIIKREAMGKMYGVILVTEGLVDKMAGEEILKLFETIDRGHEMFARKISEHLLERRKERNYSELPRIIPRHVGFELRAADPNATDRELARDLGYGSMHYLLAGGSDHMITMQGQNLTTIALDDENLSDPKTGKTIVKQVDIKSLGFEVATKYMIRLRKSDIEDSETLDKMAKVARMEPQQFVEYFKNVAK